MPFDYGLRLNDRQRIANAREKSIEANKNQSVDGAEGLFLGSGAPQHFHLLPEHPNFRLDRCPRPKQINDHPNNKADKISHPVTASPDSRSTASQIEFATGTAVSGSFTAVTAVRINISLTKEEVCARATHCLYLQRLSPDTRPCGGRKCPRFG